MREAAGLGAYPTPERPSLAAVRQKQISGGAGTPGLKGPAYLKSSHVNVDGAFSNPRMSLKWAKAEKVSLLGEDLLSKG